MNMNKLTHNWQCCHSSFMLIKPTLQPNRDVIDTIAKRSNSIYLLAENLRVSSLRLAHRWVAAMHLCMARIAGAWVGRNAIVRSSAPDLLPYVAKDARMIWANIARAAQLSRYVQLDLNESELVGAFFIQFRMLTRALARIYYKYL